MKNILVLIKNLFISVCAVSIIFMAGCGGQDEAPKDSGKIRKKIDIGTPGASTSSDSQTVRKKIDITPQPQTPAPPLEKPVETAKLPETKPSEVKPKPDIKPSADQKTPATAPSKPQPSEVEPPRIASSTEQAKPQASEPKIKGEGEEKPVGAAKGEGEEKPVSAAKGEGEEKPVSAEKGEGEEKPVSAAKGEGEEKPVSAEKGEGEEKPVSAEKGEGEEKPVSAEKGEGEEKPVSAEKGEGEEKPVSAEREAPIQKPEQESPVATDQPFSSTEEKLPIKVDNMTIAAIIGIETKKASEKKQGYDPAGKVDPFFALFKNEPEKPQEKPADQPKPDEKKEKKPKREPRTPLEKADLSQLKLVGVIRSETGDRALIEDSSGKGYIVTIGTYMGIHFGKVTEIKKDRIIIEEEHEDYYGEVTVRQRELRLPKPPGEEYHDL